MISWVNWKNSQRCITGNVESLLHYLQGTWSPDNNYTSHSTLRSLNLPAALQALEQPIGPPPSLIKRADEVKSKGGSALLYDMIEKVRQLSLKNSELLDQALNAIDEEMEEDDVLRKQFGDSK